MKDTILKEIGLTGSESKVYLSLLDLGESTRGEIVNKSGVASSKIYELLEKLQEKGLVAIYMKDKIKHFKPTNPSQILNYVKQKKEALVEIEKQTLSLLPSLLASYNSSKEEQEVELVSGMQGLDMLFREQIDLLNRGEICYVIGGTWGNREAEEIRVQDFFERVHRMRQEKGIKTKMLFNLNQKEPTSNLYSSKKYPHTETKYINHNSPVAINIYSDRTIIIIFGKKITSINIKSPEVAQSFLEYFNLLWKQAKQ